MKNSTAYVRSRNTNNMVSFKQLGVFLTDEVSEASSQPKEKEDMG
jgi:hypothetical protein